MLTSDRIAFIGAGNMARSLMGGLIATGREPGSVMASDPDHEALATAAALGVETTPDNNRAVDCASVVVLAVKPQVLGSVMKLLAPSLEQSQLLLSIAAGVPVQAIVRWAGQPMGVVRCMPNTPALVGMGASALYANEHVSAQQRTDAARILESVGEAVWVDSEVEIDVVTAVSGSGPAYVFYLMEAMIAAGVELGLDADVAQRLTLQTVRGAAEMARSSTVEPAELRRNVTSPGGTTEAALGVFDSHGLAATIRSALAAAARRARELAAEFGAERGPR